MLLFGWSRLGRISGVSSMLAGTEYDALQLTLGLVQKGAVVDAIGETRLFLQTLVIMIHRRGEQSPSMLLLLLMDGIVPLLPNVRRFFENVRDFKAIESEDCCRSQNDNCKAG